MSGLAEHLSQVWGGNFLSERPESFQPGQAPQVYRGMPQMTSGEVRNILKGVPPASDVCTRLAQRAKKNGTSV